MTFGLYIAGRVVKFVVEERAGFDEAAAPPLPAALDAALLQVANMIAQQQQQQGEPDVAAQVENGVDVEEPIQVDAVHASMVRRARIIRHNLGAVIPFDLG